MRQLTTHVELLRLRSLLDAIDDGLIALPDFQRDFIWSDSDVRSLLVTVFRRWPAGSLLLIQGEPAPFRIRPIVGSPMSPDPQRVERVVLDGQQRLTALYQALTNRGPYVYALDVSLLLGWGEEDVEEAIVSFTRARWDREEESFRERGRLLLPLYVLRSPSDYFRWVESASFRNDSAGPDLEAKLIDLHSRILGGVESYEFPATVLDRDLPVTAIARIFETVNRTGLRLSTFDLVVARSYDENWNLRDEWEAARTQSQLIDRFVSDDPVRVLQVIALRLHSNVRQSAVLALDPDEIRSGWAEAVAGVDATLRFLVQECGVLTGAWMPYVAMMLPLAALAVDHDLDEHREVLRDWFFASAFGLAFEVGANTAVVSHYYDLQRAVESGERLDPGPVLASSLLEATRQRRGALWRAFMCALVTNEARDLTGESLGLREASETLEPPLAEVVVASVFPRSHGIDGLGLHLRVLGQVLTTRETARRLGGGEPLLSYLASDPGTEGDRVVVDAGLATQFLPSVADLRRFALVPPQLLTARLQLLDRFLTRETGRPIEWDIDAGRSVTDGLVD